MDKSFIISLEVYPFDLLCYFGDKDNLLKYLGKFFNENEVNEIKDFVKWEHSKGKFIRYETRHILWMPNEPLTSADFGILQHEIFHFVTFFMDLIGQSLELCKSDESYSYLVQFVTEKIYLKLGYK